MKFRSIRAMSILLVIVLFVVGCTSAGDSGMGATALPTGAPAASTAVPPTAAPAATQAEAVAPTAAPEQSEVVPQTGENSGGLVVAVDPQKSEARYRVREQLANRDLPNDAVGRTNAITGSITINPDGSIDAASSKITVDLSTLQTDVSMRDNYVRRNVLQTSQFPTATFVPKQVSGLSWPLPQAGAVTFQLTGDLTIRDVTKTVTWEVSGEIEDSTAGLALGSAKTSFSFAEFNLQQPRVPSVLSIDDNIILEVDVALQPAGQ